MKELLSSSDAVIDWIRDLADKRTTFFPQQHGKMNHSFDLVGNLSVLQFDHYRPTIVPPGKKLSPAHEELFRFSKKQNGHVEIIPAQDKSSRILAGVRPCDLKAIALMDMVLHDGICDPYYHARRINTAIITYVCPEPCDENCFCDSTGSLNFEEGADILLIPVEEGILVESKTKMGDELLKEEVVNFASCKDATVKKMSARAARPKYFGRQLKADTADLPGMLKNHWKSPLWDKHVERCFSCGTCNMVCPTCYCFEVRDDLNLDVSSGDKTRTWDSCMLPNFAIVAGGHNFRQKPAARQRHRVKRKFEYLTEKYNRGSFCVGCGRCGRQCTSGIDIFDIVNDFTNHKSNI